MSDPLQRYGFLAELNEDTRAEQKSQLGQAGSLAKQKKGGLLGSLIGSQLGKFAVDKLLGTYLKAQFGPMGVLMGKALGAGLGAWGGTKLGVGRKKDIGAGYGAGTGLLGSGYERLGKLQDSISGMAGAQGLGAGVGTFVSGLGSMGLGKAKDVLGGAKHLDPSVSADSLRPDLDYNFDETGKGMRELKGYDTNIMSDFDADYSDAFEMTGAGDMVGLEFPDYDTFSLPSAPSSQEKTLKNLGIMQNIDLGGSPAGGALESAKQGLFDYEGYIPDELLPSFTGPRTASAASTSGTLFGQQGGSVGGLLGLQMGGMPGTSNPIPYQNGGEAENELTYGQRFVERFPSKHEDPERAAGQERGLASIIDFLIPQSPLDVLMSVAPVGAFGKVGKKAMKKILERAKKVPGKKSPFREGRANVDMQYYTDYSNWASSPQARDEMLEEVLSPKRRPLSTIYDEEGEMLDLVDVLKSQGLQQGGYMQRYNLGGSVAQQPMSYQLGGLLKYKRNPMVG